MKDSGVNYVDSSVNPTEGCPGCELWTGNGIRTCYAGRMHEQYHGAGSFGTLALKPGRMAVVQNWSDLRGKPRPYRHWMDGLPRTIFISDISDAFLAPPEYLAREVIAPVRATPQHLYLWPTKRPRKAIELSDYLVKQGSTWPGNLVLGISITWPDETVNRLRAISGINNAWPIKPFISYEPAFGNPSILTPYLSDYSMLIFGGASGPGTLPVESERAERVLDACRAAGVCFFMKQMGGGARHDALTDLPEHLRVREYPREFYW